MYENELDKACFQHGMAQEYFKDLTRITTCGNILRDRGFNIAKSPKYDGYQRNLASMGTFLVKNQQKNYRKQLLET